MVGQAASVRVLAGYTPFILCRFVRWDRTAETGLASSLAASLLKALSEIEGTVLTNDQEGSVSTGWPATVSSSVSRLHLRTPRAGKIRTSRRAN